MEDCTSLFISFIVFVWFSWFAFILLQQHYSLEWYMLIFIIPVRTTASAMICWSSIPYSKGQTSCAFQLSSISRRSNKHLTNIVIFSVCVVIHNKYKVLRPWIEVEINELDHFTVAYLVAWPLNESEAGGEIVLIETSAFLTLMMLFSY